MSDCPTNTTVSEQIKYEKAPADFLQGIINRLQDYWDKYNISNMQESVRIGNTYSQYTTDIDAIYTDSFLSSRVSEIQEYMDNYSETYDDAGVTLSWESTAQYEIVKKTNADDLKDNLESLEAQCWACHTGDESCTCNIACDTYIACTCNATCYSVGCYCNAAAHGYACICNYAAFDAGVYAGVPFCGCNGVCHGYSCSCHNLCYSQSYCFTCNSTCYSYSCNCYGTCYAYSCNQCYGTTY